MIRILTYVPLAQVTSAWLNKVQDEALGLTHAASPANALGASFLGEAGTFLLTKTTAPLLNATPTLLDDTADYRDRWVRTVTTFPSATQLPGGADDYELDDPYTGPYTAAATWKYLGTGAVANLGTGAAVSAGVPPVLGAGAFRSYRVSLTTHLDVSSAAQVGPWLYADPTTGALYLYQASGGSLALAVHVSVTAKTGKRP